jgi:uncharacterized protein YggE
MRPKTNNLVLTSLFLFTACSQALAREAPEPRVITVTGDADVLVQPDEVVVRLSVQTKDKDLDDARSRADRRTKKVLTALKKQGVLPKHVKTDHMNIWPDFRYEEEDVRAYRVRKGIVVTVKDVEKLEDILGYALEFGANGVDGVEYRSTILRRHKDRARLLAIQAAREKASAMAAALGQRIGRPHSITEQPPPAAGWGGWWWRRNQVAQNVVQNAGPAQGSTGEVTAPGQIRINAKVTVSFELK